MNATARVPITSVSGEIVGHAVVDADVLPIVEHHRWSLLRATSGLLYAVRWEKNRPILMHRQIMATAKGFEVDHIDGDGLNNVRFNLRNVTHAQNQQNKRANAVGTSRYRGVYWSISANQWRACVRLNGHKYHVGYFRDELQAAKAAADWRTKHMPFATSRTSAQGAA